MSITPELQTFLEHPALKPHADRLLNVIGKVPASRQTALVRFLEGWLHMNGQRPEPPRESLADSVLSVAEKWPSIVGPFAKETGLVLAMARFCHEHPHDLSAWLAERNLDEHLIRPWISRWIRGQAVLEKLHQANNIGPRSST